MKFSEKIKLLRNKNNETQQDLANYLNVTFQSISKWENGQNLPTIDVLLEISKHYNVDLEILINDEIILDDKPNNYKEKTFYPSRNKEGLLSIYLDSDGVYTAIYNEKFHRTNTIVATQPSSNKNDYIIAVNEQGTIIYLARSTGYGFGSPCDDYYHSAKDNQTSQIECFYLLKNYAPFGDGTRKYENWEFVIPKNGFILVISDRTLESNSLFNFLNKNNGVKKQYDAGELDDIKMIYKDNKLIVSYLESTKDIIKNTIKDAIIEPIIKKYIDESEIIKAINKKVDEYYNEKIDDMENQIDDLENQIHDLENQIDDLEERVNYLE